MSNYVVPDANTIITLAKMDKWSQIGFADDPTGGQYYLNQLLSPNSTLVITISVLAEVTAQYGNLKASDVGIISDWFSQIQANKIGGNSVLLYQDTQQPSKGAGERSIDEFIQSQSLGIF